MNKELTIVEQFEELLREYPNDDIYHVSKAHLVRLLECGRRYDRVEFMEDNLKERIHQFDKVIRDVCTELKLTYGGVDVDSGEIVKVIKQLQNDLKARKAIYNVEPDE